MKKNRFILVMVASLLVITACNNSTADSSSVTPEPSSSSLTPSSESSSSSSSSSIPEKIMEEKTIKAYRLFNRDNDYLDPDLSEDKYKLGEVKFSFVKGQEFIPYITLSNISELYGRFYKNKETTKNNVSLDGDKYTWSVTNNSTEIFRSTIDIKEKTFTYSGGLENYVETKKDYNKYSIMLRTKTDTSAIDLPTKHAPLISYKETEFEVIKEDGETYFPFSMLHTFYHELTGHDFFYNYVYLYEYNESDDLSKATVTDGDDLYTPLDQMGKYIEAHVTEKDAGNKPLMPMYLRKFHRSEFTLLFENYYGLRSTWGVKSMKEYFSNYGLYDKLIDDNAAVRGAAYSRVFFMLSDSHTGRTVLGDNPWIESNGNAEVDPAAKSALSEERSLISQSLTEQRTAFLKANGFEDGIHGALIYSADGKTAYFGFDGFDGLTNAYNSDGTVKSDEVLAKKDSYFYFVKMLNEIKAHRTTVGTEQVKVENVIIDDSLNGGGYVAVMGRLLALISKDNSAVVTSLNEQTDVVTKYVYHVDTDNNGIYDEKDVFGNDFNFYILTSPISFSCGNAFPIFASKQFSHVKIIGTKSGGGECVVGENYFSNGMVFAHSSNEHIILLNEEKKTYEGFEKGVQVDSTIKYCNYYNMDEMIKAINRIVK